MNQPAPESRHRPRGSSGRQTNRLAALWRGFVRAELGPLVALIVTVIVFTALDSAVAEGRFASIRNLRVILAQSSTVAVAALGMTIVIIAGGIDLSAGTALSLCATLLAVSLKQDHSVALALTFAVLAGALCGLNNGVLISLLKVPPFIVTLGTMTMFLGLAKILADETTVFPAASQIPTWLGEMSSTKPPDAFWGFLPRLPSGVWFAGLLSVLVAVLLRLTVFGRHVFALGSNEQTARLCGINVPQTKILVYVLAGCLFGVAGVFRFSQLRIGDPVGGIGLELQVIAAVVIGGGSLNGGRGSVVGTLTGAVIMAVIRSGCDQLGISNPIQEIILGAIIITAVATDRFTSGSEQQS